jgi:hypothetical protein
MHPREQHLLNMLDRALEVIEALKLRAQQAEVKAAAVVAIECRLARIERVLRTATGGRPVAWRPDGSADADIKASLAAGPLTASAVARSVYKTGGAPATNSERSNVRSMLQRMVRDREVIFDPVGKTYELAHAVIPTSSERNGHDERPS